MKKILSKKLRLIAYCGLYCPKCYKMKISAVAKKFLDELESAQNKGAKLLHESSNIKLVLEKLIALECKKFCREGGCKTQITAKFHREAIRGFVKSNQLDLIGTYNFQGLGPTDLAKNPKTKIGVKKIIKKINSLT